MIARIIFFVLLAGVIFLAWHGLRTAAKRMSQGNRFPLVGWLGVVECLLATAGICLMFLVQTAWAPWVAIGILIPGVLPLFTAGGVMLMSTLFIKR